MAGPIELLTRGLAEALSREPRQTRHTHGLAAPRDVDVPPCLAVIAPTLQAGFDRRALAWHGDGEAMAA